MQLKPKAKMTKGNYYFPGESVLFPFRLWLDKIILRMNIMEVNVNQKISKRVFAAFLSFLLLVIFSGFVFGVNEKPEKVRYYEGVTEYRLSNGMMILLVPDSTKSTVTSCVTYRVGARFENYGEIGLAHMVEHMVFNGSTQFPDLKKEFLSRGISYNGSTNSDRTNYFETVQYTDENLEFLFKAESDRMVNITITPEKLTTERTILLNELAMAMNDPGSMLEMAVSAVTFPDQGYGHDIGGIVSDLKYVPIERVQAFYKTYYQPDNAVLSVSGKFDVNKTLELAQKYFGAIPKPQRVLPRTYTVQATQFGEREVTVRLLTDSGSVSVNYRIPAFAHPDIPALKVLMRILVDKPRGRLYQKLVEGKKILSVGGYVPESAEPDRFSINAEVSKDQTVTQVKEEVLAVIQDLLDKNPVTDAEVTSAKNTLAYFASSRVKDASRLGMMLGVYASYGDWRLFFLDRDRTEKVTTADVQRVAQYYLKPENRVIGYLIPGLKKNEGVEIPEVTNLEEILKPYQQEEKIVKEEIFETTPENLEKNTRRENLPNGMKIAFLKKPQRSGRVIAQLQIRVCNEKDILAGQIGINRLVVPMLFTGTKNHTQAQIKETFEKLKSQVNGFGSNNTTTFMIDTNSENLLPVLQMVAELLKEPVFDPKEFDILKQSRLSGLENAKLEPMSIVGMTLNNHLFPKGHVSHPLSADEDIAFLKALDVKTLGSFYKDYYGAEMASLSVIGDITPEPIIEFCKKEFLNWKNLKKPGIVSSSFPQGVTPINKSIDITGKPNGMINLGMVIPLGEKNPDYPAMQMANYILGGKGMTSRLGTRIRQKEGLSYSVNSSFGSLEGNQCSLFMAMAIADSPNIEKAEKCFFEEFNKVVKEGFQQAELTEGIDSMIKSESTRLASDSMLAFYLIRHLERGETFTKLLEDKEKIKALTLEKLNEVLRKYFIPANISVVKAGDFSRK